MRKTLMVSPTLYKVLGTRFALIWSEKIVQKLRFSINVSINVSINAKHCHPFRKVNAGTLVLEPPLLLFFAKVFIMGYCRIRIITGIDKSRMGKKLFGEVSV
jgi:hypothetical protein